MTTMTTMALDRDALVDRLFEATVGTLELFGVYLGQRLDLYAALAEHADLSAGELATIAGIHPRYAREWLEQQAVAGFLTVSSNGENGEAGEHGEPSGPAGRRYALPAPHREVLAEPENTAFVAPFSLLVAGVARALPEVVEAYRTGGGVPWTSYGVDARDGQAAINRPTFLHEMAAWVAAMPDVRARLDAPGARIADVGCGAGWSTIAMAEAFPQTQIDGFDVDEASIADAIRNTREAGMVGRVSFAVHDAADRSVEARYDLVCIFEALHDMARPVEALVAARSMMARGGAVLVVDERVADEFTAPGDAVERMMYGWSITCCLPSGMVDQPSAATGTVMRADLLRRYATEAGFTTAEVLPVDHDLFRFYRLGA